MNYTIKQIATLLEVTPQAIYKRINDTDGNNELIKYIQTDDKGRKLIDNDGLEYLRQVFNKTVENEPRNDLNSELIEVLKTEIKRRDNEIERLYRELESTRAEYKEQLRVKDEQIERSQRQSENAQSIIYAMQQTQSKRKLLDFFKKPTDEERS